MSVQSPSAPFCFWEFQTTPVAVLNSSTQFQAFFCTMVYSIGVFEVPSTSKRSTSRAWIAASAASLVLPRYTLATDPSPTVRPARSCLTVVGFFAVNGT